MNFVKTGFQIVWGSFFVWLTYLATLKGANSVLVFMEIWVWFCFAISFFTGTETIKNEIQKITVTQKSISVIEDLLCATLFALSGHIWLVAAIFWTCMVNFSAWVSVMDKKYGTA